MLQPTLQTARLVLRPFSLADAPDVKQFAGMKEIARVTQNIPHPYQEGMAEDWIAMHADNFAEGKAAQFAVILREPNAFCGVVSLEMKKPDGVAILGYWIAPPFWGNGYCTEAARALVNYGFESLSLQRICADHFGSNPASGRVMSKIGMKWEGCLRSHVLKWGEREDDVIYGLLRSEWEIP